MARSKTKVKQPVYIAVTPKGREYFRQMQSVGYVSLPADQKTDWNILSDLVADGGAVKMSTFLAEGRDTVIGRRFTQLSEASVAGYATALHKLIKGGYIRAFEEEPEMARLERTQDVFRSSKTFL